MKLAIREDNTIVYLDSPDGPYHVVSKSIDPYNKYDYDELQAYALSHPEDIEQEPVIEPKKPSEIVTLQSYLNDTDWYVTRFVETQKPIPEDVLIKREEARLKISELRTK